MKTKKIITLAILVFSTAIYSQQKTCNATPEETFEDLNTISFSKCAISKKEKTTTKRKISSSATQKSNRIAHYVRKDNKTSYKNSKSYLKNNTVLLSLVDEIPLLKKCYNTKDRNCFNKQFYNYFTKNFNAENVIDNELQGRVFVQFTIDIKGAVSDITIKGSKNTKYLEKEITRVLRNLPITDIAKQKGIPVAVTHALPINLKAN